MNKKAIVALVLALVLCMTSVVAFAASKSTGDVVSTKTTPTTQTTTEQPTEVVVAPSNADSEAELEALAALVAEGKPVSEFFETDLEDDVKVDELVPISVAGTQAVSVTLSTAASYSDDAKVFVLIGIKKDGKVVWQKVPCKVVNGKIVVDLSADLVQSIAGGSALLSVLSNAN